MLHADRLFSSEPTERRIARELYESVAGAPIVSPHGHTDPTWFSENRPFDNPTSLLLAPDHYLLRMLHSQGLDTRELPNSQNEAGARKFWRLFASNFHLFFGTPSKVWLEQTLSDVFGISEVLNSKSADAIYDTINENLRRPEFLPRALFDRFGIEFLATTESPLDELKAHDALSGSEWAGRVVTTYRPDPVVDPEYEGFSRNVELLAELTGENVSTFEGYLRAHRVRRAYFAKRGATATDHGHPSAATADLSPRVMERLYHRAIGGECTRDEAEMFRAQMLTEMAKMSLDDGLVMQLHPGVHRNHNGQLYGALGRDVGGDIPISTEFVRALKPLLDRFGNDRRLNLILFTLDETTYTRELAPLAGHYPALTLGPSWWFLDSPEGMLRMKRAVFETAGFYNTAGFNDDTRAFLSIPARHDMARRIDCRHLAELVADHRLELSEAHRLVTELAGGLARRAYRLDGSVQPLKEAV